MGLFSKYFQINSRGILVEYSLNSNTMTIRKLILIILAIVVLAGLFVWLRPAKTHAPSDTSPTGETRTFELTVAGGAITSGPKTLSAYEGDRIVLKVTADKSEEIHIHGLDISLDLTAGTPGTVIFTATPAGRYEFELEGSKTNLGAIEIMPR